jgi:hypothetical protein
MGMQKFRADISEPQADGAIVWCAQWLGGPSLSKIEDCRLINMAGDMRANVFVTGEPDTFFSIPAVCSLKGCRVRGYLTGDDEGNLVFRHCYY